MLRSLSRFLAAAGAAAFLLLPGGCPLEPGDPNGDGGQTARLVAFDSENDLLTYFRQQARVRTSRSDLAIFGDAGPAVEPAGTPGPGSDESGDDFTGTNIQEEGVDESDVVKTDGTHLFVARGNTVRVVAAVPRTELREIGRVTVEHEVESMYLSGSRLLVISRELTFGGGGPEILIWPPFYQSTATIVTEVDVSDPAAPAVVRSVEFDGTLASSRLIDDRLILVLTIAPTLPEPTTQITLASMSLDEVLPKRQAAGSEPQDLVPWDRWLRPTSPDGYFMTAVLTLDAADIENVIASVGVMANAGTIYASREAIYLTDSGYDEENGFRASTSIHKLAFDENGAARYTASGGVPGRLLNQFSLGEHDGYLRVATHVSDDAAISADGVAVSARADSPVTSQSLADPNLPWNAVYVLGESASELSAVGSLEGLAPGERIYSARFLGERGFLVTFRQVDPLFALDLSDATAPRAMGELKIPGYSDYLHPLGTQRLIGIGRSIDSSGGFVRPDALQLSLFDVADLTNPTLIEQEEVGGMGSYSDVSYTHKAFAMLESRSLLALPATLNVNGSNDFFFEPAFSGVLCFEVDPAAGFTEIGRLEAVEELESFYTVWRRAVLIGEDIYVVTLDGVRAASTTDFANSIALEFTD